MISYIKGKLEEQREDGIVVECQGIGYDIKTPDLTGKSIKMGDIVKVYTYMYVREDILCLYGFLKREEREVFGMLIAVNGIGPKVAVALLSTLTIEELAYAVLSDDVKMIAKTPGIGPKGAKRLIIELKDKLKIEEVFGIEEEILQEVKPKTAKNDEDAQYIAVQGLISLGYSNAEALKAVRCVKGKEEMDAETLLKAALRTFI
ncbi:MAG: Holliday junction branch migration protein RuvA [Lachnospiraceae bacterium]